MTAIQIDGKAIANGLRANVVARVCRLQAIYKITPGLAVILVGEDPASTAYVTMKAKQARAVGVKTEQFVLPAGTSQAELLDLIDRLNSLML